ncbi:MAG: hypothetical protein ABI185_07965 [Ginsengibacter sp.]
MPAKFSEEELKNLVEHGPKVLEELDINPQLRKRFLENPFGYLRERFKILILKRFSESINLIEAFNKSMQELFRKVKRFFTQCLACKFTTLMLTFGSMSHFSLVTLGTAKLAKEAIEMIVDGIKFLIHGNNQQANNIVARLDTFIGFLDPLILATRICMIIGMCIDGEATSEI